MRSSPDTGITEHSFHGITPSQKKGESVTYVSGTICYLCVESLMQISPHQSVDLLISVAKPIRQEKKPILYPTVLLTTLGIGSTQKTPKGNHLLRTKQPPRPEKDLH